MEKIIYISENKMFICENGKSKEIPSQRAAKYRDNIRNIQKRNEWKSAGRGAMFTGAYAPASSAEGESDIFLNGLSAYDDEFIYSANIGEVGGIYRRSADAADGGEGHIAASNNMRVWGISVKDNMCAASVGNGGSARNLALFELPQGYCTELTEGDSIEDYPYFSKLENKIYFSSAGLSRTHENGGVNGVGPYSLMAFDNDKKEMEELFSDGGFDYIKPNEDEDGALYFIRRPYKGAEHPNALVDMLLFPFRIIRALFGWLNLKSMMYGGESLKTKGGRMNEKAKQKDDKELFIEGNLINAAQTLKKNRQSGEKNPGLVPRSWELIKAAKDGTQSCVKKGVLDYTVLSGGDILFSNGQAIIRLSENGEEVVQKCRLAVNITEL